ncbi:hypothetical protein [Yinghuangia sp. YIM S09857]|uniref:hypothetical protein n=1 Tax=Yinghuangia sp. YIM S09857 TaxID=3436929 RepID=UPI003F52DC67
MPTNFADIARGESWSVEFGVQNAAEQPVDLGERKVTFVLREKGRQRACVVRTDHGTSVGGSMVVDAAAGLIVVTIDPDVTLAVGSADWGLWLDEKTSTADALERGKWQTVYVPRSDDE